jgi:hypothetical protein
MAEQLLCPFCKKAFTASAWNTETLTLCTNRAHRRKYTPIQDDKTGKKWYQCPGCKGQNYSTNIKSIECEVI